MARTIMGMVVFSIPGEPVAKGRARSFVRNGHVAHYTPEKTARYENLVRLAAQQAMAGRPPTELPVCVDVTAFMKIPASWGQNKRSQAERHEIRPAKRPDLDNIVKAVIDGANGIVWRDDAQVVELVAAKLYSESPRVAVAVRSINAG